MDVSMRSKLRNGQEIPCVGFGTYLMKDKQVISSVLDTAIKSGYRMVDTAAVYRNEEYIKEVLDQALPKHGLKPEDIFITSKLAPADQGYDKALAAFDRTLQALGRSELDLYLIHWPGAQGLQKNDPQNAVLRRESWRALEELHKKGKAKAIGVSNYTVGHLKEMESYASIMPHVLQSECHPALPQDEVRAYCSQHDIFFQAYSSLGCGNLLKVDSIVKMAAGYKKTAAQVLLKWALQQGIGVIPKASTAQRVQENVQLFDFELSSEDMELLPSLFNTTSSQFVSPYHFCWDPTHIQ